MAAASAAAVAGACIKQVDEHQYTISTSPTQVLELSQLQCGSDIELQLADLTNNLLGVSILTNSGIGPILAVARSGSNRVIAFSLNPETLAAISPLLKHSVEASQCEVIIDGAQLSQLGHAANIRRAAVHGSNHDEHEMVSHVTRNLMGWLLQSGSSRSQEQHNSEETFQQRLFSIGSMIGLLSYHDSEQLDPNGLQTLQTLAIDAKAAAVSLEQRLGKCSNSTSVETGVVSDSERALSTELLRLLDTADVPIIGVDTNLLIREWNQKAIEMTGFSKKEVLGKPLVETYITAEYKDRVREVLTAAVATGQAVESYEFALTTKSGDRRELLLNATARRCAADGQIVGVLGVGLDMTHTRSAQRQLDRSEKAKLAFWGCIREGVATVAGRNVMKGAIIECNTAMCELCGVASPDELRGTTLHDILLKSGHEPEQISKLSSDGQMIEFCLQGSDSTVKHCEATFMEIPALTADESDRNVQMALVVRDRTWKKELERQATELMLRAERVRTLNKQLKWVQHQVKNSALALNFRLRQVIDVLSKEEVYAVVDGVEAEFDALEQEVHSLMDSLEKHVMLGEMASGCYLPRFKEHDVKSMMGQIFRKTNGIDSQHMFRACLDIGALHHATSNLESNADKYSAPDTQVDKVVRMYKKLPPEPSEQDTAVVQGLQIGDKIPGGPDTGAVVLAMMHIAVSNTVVANDFQMMMALQSQEGGLHSLFDEGRRISAAWHASVSKGEGLALTKSVCASLFGTLWVHLESETRKISFHMTVPVLLPSVGPSAHMQSGVGVLAIDDCPTQRMMLTVYLKKLQAPFKVLGERPSHYTDICSIANNFVRQHGGVKLVAILDQNLQEDPLILGTELSKQLRGHCAAEDLVILIRSANTMTDDIKLYLQEADGFLEKNDSFPTLRSKIIAQLSAHDEHQRPVDDTDESFEEMEATTVNAMKAGLLQAIERWLVFDHAVKWEASKTQLHSIKGSIKGIEGMIGPEPPPEEYEFAQLVKKIDTVLQGFVPGSTTDQTAMLEDIEESIISFAIWLQSW